MKNIFRLLAVFAVAVLSGCSTSYNSLAQRPDGHSDIIVASESEVLSASFEAITRSFPSANIQPLAKPLKGYAWFHMPLLDRTDFRFMLSRRIGEASDGKSIRGWSYNVVTHGTQGLVEARYVNPLVNELNSAFKERNIQVISVKKVTYVSDADESEKVPSTKSASSGTGFFVSADGFVVTNHHVVEDASQIEARDITGKVYAAKVVSIDASNDIALLKIDTSAIPLPISKSSAIKKGSEVFTLGYPVVGIQGQEQKATFGRINALSGIQGDIRYFQIDVPIQPGNSGGPLISDDGSVIAIVTASLNQINVLKATGSLPQSVNYAVKSEYFLPLLEFAHVITKPSQGKDGAIKDPSQFEKSIVHIVAR
jgi:S1-C subfamily serine protease